LLKVILATLSALTVIIDVTSFAIAGWPAIGIAKTFRRKRNFMNIEIIGFIAAALMVVTLAMKTMIPLRAVFIIGSIFQIAFALLQESHRC
jgi:hypothetical protein